MVQNLSLNATIPWCCFEGFAAEVSAQLRLPLLASGRVSGTNAGGLRACASDTCPPPAGLDTHFQQWNVLG